jgi:hypothetical protein
MYQMLLNSEPFQKELKMTSSQREKLKAASRGFQERVRANPARVTPEQQRAMPREERTKAQLEMFRRGNEIWDQNVIEMNEILSEKQQDRIGQIILQIKGPLAVAEPEVATAIGLEEEQFSAVKAVVAEMTDAQTDVVVATSPFISPAARAEIQKRIANRKDSSKKRAAKAPPRGSSSSEEAPDVVVQPAAGKAETVDDPSGALASAQRAHRIAGDVDEVRSDAVEKISKILTKTQRIAFNQLLGAPVKDLGALVPDRIVTGPVGVRRDQR